MAAKDTTTLTQKIDQLSKERQKPLRKLRDNLEIFFYDPFNRLIKQKKYPWKFVAQVIFLILVFLQLYYFSDIRTSRVNFVEETISVMKQKFLKDWDSTKKIPNYPPENGRTALFSSRSVVEHFSFAVVSYYQIENETFALFSYDTEIPKPAILFKEFQDEKNIPPLKFCINRIASVTQGNGTIVFDVREFTDCYDLRFTHSQISEIQQDPINILKYMDSQNLTLKAEDVLVISKATLSFNLRTIHFSNIPSEQNPACYLIELKIIYDNTEHSGEVFVELNTHISSTKKCNLKVYSGKQYAIKSLLSIINDGIICLWCLVSFLLIILSFSKAYKLMKETQNKFAEYISKDFNWLDRWEFVNFWNVIIIISDIFIFVGTIGKDVLKSDFDSDLFTITGILLGFGFLLACLGFCQYLGYFTQFNVLILTIRKAFANVVQFLFAIGLIFFGFTVAGWVIVGPYSNKFRTLPQSATALFSLMNGDGMYDAFYAINELNFTIYVFGKLYIIVFVFFFIYVVLSFFIAIIDGAHESVQNIADKNQQIISPMLREFLQYPFAGDEVVNPVPRSRSLSLKSVSTERIVLRF